MRFFFAAILFLLAVGLFTFLAKVVYQGNVETELQSKALSALDAAGLGDVTVEFDHHEARIAGMVDSVDEKQEVLTVLAGAVPLADLPAVEELDLKIRPTIPPEIFIQKPSGSSRVTITGVLGAHGEGNRGLLGSRIHSLEVVEAIDNTISFDPMRLPLLDAAELASLAVSLIEHSDEATVRYAGGVLEIAGQVPNDGLREGLLELAAQVRADNLIEKIEVVAPEVFLEPSTLTMTRNRFGISVSGAVGSEEEKRKLDEIVGKLGKDSQFASRIDVREGLSVTAWQENSEKILPLLLGTFLGEMTAEFGDGQVRLSGKVAAEEDRNSVLAAIAPLKNSNPELEILSDIQVESGSTTGGVAAQFLATYENGILELTGILPDTSFAESLEAGFKETFPDVIVKIDLEESPESSGAEWMKNLEEFFEEIPTRIESAVITLTEDTLKMEGTTVELADRQVFQNVAINTVPASYTIENLLMHANQPFPEPEMLPEDREKLAETLQQYPIYFGSNSDVVTEEEREKVTSIQQALEAAGPPADLLVTGFADNVGNEEYNQKLSLRRADAVLKALVSLGIDENLMTTKSEGEDVSGVSRSERWKARRVEVSLAPKETGAAPSE